MKPYLLLMPVCLTACSGAKPYSDDWGDPQFVEQGLGWHEQCDTAPADVAIFEKGLTISSRSYGSDQCHNAFVVDLLEYAPIEEGGAPFQRISWADAIPTTESACVKAQMMVYVWERLAQGLEPLVSGISVNGFWQFGGCTVPRIDAPDILRREPPLKSGHSYRYGMSARQMNSAGTAYGLRKIQLKVQ